MAALASGHVAALAVVGRVLRAAQGPWWVIAGAAVALHSRLPVAVDDIDILLAVEDVPLVAAMPGIARRSGDGDALFRSDFYASVAVAGVAIEFMAGFRAKHEGVWQQVLPQSRIWVPVGDVAIPVPDRAEMIDMLARFGRPSDLQRMALLMD